MSTVVNIAHDRSILAEPDIVRIDRETRWRNPLVIGKDGDRVEVIARYRAWLWREIAAGRIALADLAALASKRLACWCSPSPCHGDILARAAHWAAARLGG